MERGHRAAGFQTTKQFQHKPKIRRLPEEEQRVKLSAWDEIMERKTGRVDVERANECGTIYTQSFDARPRHNPVLHDAFKRYVAADKNFNPIRWKEDVA